MPPPPTPHLALYWWWPWAPSIFVNLVDNDDKE
jgi:hypothetical protein